MPKRPDLVLFHIREAIQSIQRHTAGKSLESYCADDLVCRAVERWVEIISEASRNVPDDFKAEQPGIDWRAVADIGNVLRHDYDHVRDEVNWNVVVVHLQPHLAAVDAIAAAHGIDLDPTLYRD